MLAKRSFTNLCILYNPHYITLGVNDNHTVQKFTRGMNGGEVINPCSCFNIDHHLDTMNDLFQVNLTLGDVCRRLY